MSAVASFDDPRQVLFLDRYATYTGSDPRRAPAVLSVVPYVEHTFRGWYVGGGLRQIAVAVRERAEQRKVRVITGAEVTRISTAHGRVDGVELTDGRRLDADLVVSDVDAGLLYEQLLPRPELLRPLRRATPSLSGFVLMLGVRGHAQMPHHSVLFGSDYDAEMDAVFGPDARPVDDPTIYISAPPDAAPDGHQAWFVLVNAPRHGSGPGCVDWDAPGVASAYADEDPRPAGSTWTRRARPVAVREHRTPADLERDTSSPGGAIYGTAKTAGGPRSCGPPTVRLSLGCSSSGGQLIPAEACRWC